MVTCFSIVLTGKLPFHHVMMHGVVCDSQGKKMSKSKGNVVDPLHVINGRSLKELEEDLKLTGQALMNEKELQKALKSLKATFPSGIPKCGTDALRFSLVHNDKKKLINDSGSRSNGRYLLMYVLHNKTFEKNCF